MRAAPAIVLVLASCAAAAREKGTALAPVPGLRAETVAAAGGRPKRVALLIGAGRFRDGFWPQLRWAAKDAEDLASALRDPGLGAFDEVQVLTSEEDTARRRVLEAVDRLATLAPQPEDTVVVYFSTHGSLALTPDRGPRRVLVLEDTEHADLERTGLPVADLLARFDALPSERKALILATCHSGGGKSLLTPEVERFMAGVKGSIATIEEVSRASLVLSASDFGQAAREDDRLANDVYTHFLLGALREGADANGDGAISATEAHDYARRRTWEFTGGLQLPTVRSVIAGADPVVLAGNATRPGLPVLFSYHPGFDGLEVRVAGQAKGVLPGNVVLEEGAQKIELGRPGEPAEMETEVVLEPGARVAAEALLLPEERRWQVSVGGGFFAILGDAGGHLARPVPRAVAALHLRDAMWANLDPIFDAGFGTSSQSVTPFETAIPQTVTLISVGAGLMVRGAIGPVELHAGPHLAYVVLLRALSPPGLDERQSIGAFAPGGMAGASVALGRFEVRLDGDLHLLPLRLDGDLRATAAAGLSAGVGWRF